MGKRKSKKISSTLTWKALRGSFQILLQGLFKGTPLLLFGLAGLGVFWLIREDLYADPGFVVNQVEVLPEGALSETRVAELERAFLGENLFKITLSKASENLERDPRIRVARVTRQFPRTIRIEVTERLAFANVRIGLKGPYYRIGEDGVVLGLDSVADDRLVLVEELDPVGNKFPVGERVHLAGLGEGIDLAKAFWKHPLAKIEKLDRIRLDRLGNVALVLKNGPELRFGRRPLKKLGMLGSLEPLLRGPERNRILYLELQYQDLVVRKK